MVFTLKSAWVSGMLFMGLGMVAAHGGDDILVADFEQADYGAWQVEGEAFGPGPAAGTLPGQMRVEGFRGKRLVNSFYNGDAAVGMLTSPPFRVERACLNFLIGGGGHGEGTSVSLFFNGQRVRMATGPNTQPGGSERLHWTHWEVSEFMDKEVVIQIVDQETGSWGHINADHFVQSDVPLTSNRTFAFTAEQRYLNLPVKSGAPKKWMRLRQGETLLREFELELAPDTPDFWAYLELTPFLGAALTLTADDVERDNAGFASIQQSEAFIGSETVYQEAFRPQCHFSSKRGWLNDPNGLVYYDGEYHLFYQHNPYGWHWGNMTWGHAVSRDLVHWEELGDAIHPDGLGTIFSGSAVVDEANAAGFQQGQEKALICIYTYAGGTNQWSQGQKFTQALAYSNDRGRTWTKYDGNPVQGHIRGDNRDPKVIWHAPSNQWVIALYVDEKNFAFFTSPDLKHWEKQSELLSFYECPELFPIALEGEPEREAWVLYGASGEYFVGIFDGKQFVPDGTAVQYNYGDCFYASQTFNNIPESDGRRIQIAWGQTGHPDMPFNQMMNFPVELTLRATEEGPRLFAWPVREIETLHQQSHAWDNLTLKDRKKTLEGPQGGCYDMELAFDVRDAAACGVIVGGLEIVYDVQKQELRCNDKIAPLAPQDNIISLRLITDRLSVEIFANHGRIYMPMKHHWQNDAANVVVFARNGSAAISRATVVELASIWRTP